MPVSFIQVGKYKVAPFKYSDAEPYGAFANTTKAGKYSVTQEVKVHGEELSFIWPSSEHAYHAQKILHLKSRLKADDSRQTRLTGVLRIISETKSKEGEEFLPDDYKKIVDNLTPSKDFGKDKEEFDTLCDANYHSVHNPNEGLMQDGKPYTLDFMMQVMRLKLEQHSDLKQLAINCAKEGIMPVEVSPYDDNWASGKSGKGKNMLGIAILELGNEYLLASYGTPKIANPQKYYNELVKDKQNDLKHDALVRYTYSKNQSERQQLKETTNVNLNNSQLKKDPPKESPAEYVKNRLLKKGFKDVLVEIVPDQKYSSQKVIKLTFKNTVDATRFKSEHSGNNTPVSDDGSKLFLGPNRAPKVFEKLGIEFYGIKHPVPTMQALIKADMDMMQQKNNNTTEKSEELNKLEQIKGAVFSAQEKYAAWYKNHNENSRGPVGFFTWLRHGQKGQNKATLMKSQIQDIIVNEEKVVKEINNFLIAPETRYHRHSFSSFLLDELSQVKGSPWQNITAGSQSKLYDKNEVISVLSPRSNSYNI